MQSRGPSTEIFSTSTENNPNHRRFGRFFWFLILQVPSIEIFSTSIEIETPSIENKPNHSLFRPLWFSLSRFWSEMIGKHMHSERQALLPRRETTIPNSQLLFSACSLDVSSAVSVGF